MSGPIAVQPDPSMIGGVAKAPFVLLPEPKRLFARRAERFEALASSNALAPYLRFLGALTRIQAALATELPSPAPVPREQIERARAAAMPPLDRSALVEASGLHAALERLFDAAVAVEKPSIAAEALRAVQTAEQPALDAMIENVVADAIPFDELAQHLFVTAGLQVFAALMTTSLQAEAVVPVATGVCPVCGGPPGASVVVGFQGAESARYAACSFCGTLWNEVRVKCLACGSTKGIGYREVENEGEAATVKAEVCDECRSWVKILYQNNNPSLEAVADDVGTLGLDILMQSSEYRRAGYNPFLLGY